MKKGPKTNVRHPANTGFRKPTALHLINGNPSRLNLKDRNEPQPPIEAPPAPAYLKGEALAEWNRITPKLLALRLLSQLDRAALAAYCKAWGRYVEAEEKLNDPVANPLTVMSNNGYPCMSPWLKISNDAATIMRRFIGEFGLSPSSRVKLSMPESPQPLAKEKAAPNAAGENATPEIATESATESTEQAGTGSGGFAF